ncbi:MAG: hypothetical protein LBQ73_09105 [Tannerellaceae bacterium]|jgi:hypothetical protein|nr:hypothetical protein [Tannerellaceae bacterium]
MRGRQSSYGKRYSVDTPLNYILLLGTSFFFWVAGYMDSVGYPVYSEVSATPLWDLVCRMLPNKTVTYLIGLLLTVGGAFLIHRANYMLVIIREKTLLPFLLYVLLISTNPNFFPLNSTSLGIFCLILAFYQLLTSYHDSGAIRKTFNAAFFIGVGSLLWVHILWFFPIFWWGMYNFKVLNLRTFLASIAGVGVVYWFLLGWCVWQHDFTPFSVPFASLLKAGLPDDFGSSRLIDWIHILYVAFLTAIAIVNIMLHEHDDTLRTRRFLSFLVMLSAASLCLFLLYRQLSDEFLDVACMPVSILVAHFFTVEKGKKRLRLYYLFIILFILISLIRSSWMSSLNMVI